MCKAQYGESLPHGESFPHTGKTFLVLHNVHEEFCQLREQRETIPPASDNKGFSVLIGSVPQTDEAVVKKMVL
jgi:hypothetical protein